MISRDFIDDSYSDDLLEVLALEYALHHAKMFAGTYSQLKYIISKKRFNLLTNQFKL